MTNPEKELNVCQCGCGHATCGRFVRGHNRKSWPTVTDAEHEAHRQIWLDAGVPYGLCLCGCGTPTAVAPDTSRRTVRLAGEPQRYVRGHGYRRKVLYVVEDRGFRTPCWIVTGYLNLDGYGYMVDDTGKQRCAHIVMWEREHGPVPDDLQLDHLCVQPPCIRPEHLEPVTNAVNSRRSRSAKLTADDVQQVRQLLKAKVTHREIASRFGVCTATISHIASGRNWRPPQTLKGPR